MSLLKLNVETLASVDFGKVDASFMLALERAVKDCDDRPTDDRARKVTLTLELVPIPRVEGTNIFCDGANGKFKTKCSVPDHETGVINFGVQQNGDLIFSPASPKTTGNKRFLKMRRLKNDSTRRNLSAICDLATKAASPEIVRLNDVPCKAWIVIAGDPIEIDLPPPLREHSVESVDDLAAFIGAHDEGRCTVWHSSERVLLIIDDATRVDTVTMPLRKTDGWLYIETMQEWWPQRDFIFCLRRLGFDGSTIAAFRSLDWQTSAGVKSEINHGKDRLGKQVQGTVAGTADLPQELCINAVIYRNAGEDAPVNVPFMLDYDISQQRIYFQPEPDSLALSERIHQRDLHERILMAVPEGVEVYHGSP